MMKIKVKVRGNWNKTEVFLKDAKTLKKIKSILERFGREGVIALSSATPVDTGETATSWDYRIDETRDGISLNFINTNLTSTGIPIAILLQHGHGNGKGGYIQGRDFINPAIQPIFDKIAEEAWKEVTN